MRSYLQLIILQQRSVGFLLLFVFFLLQLSHLCNQLIQLFINQPDFLQLAFFPCIPGIFRRLSPFHFRQAVYEMIDRLVNNPFYKSVYIPQNSKSRQRNENEQQPEFRLIPEGKFLILMNQHDLKLLPLHRFPGNHVCQPRVIRIIPELFLKGLPIKKRLSQISQNIPLPIGDDQLHIFPQYKIYGQIDRIS